MKNKLNGLIKNKYALIIIVVGLGILIFPTELFLGEKTEAPPSEKAEIAAPGFSLKEEEERLKALLGQIRGVGRVSVLLSVQGSATRELAQSGEEVLVISENGAQRVVDLYFENPVYVGAVVVCDGAKNSSVRLEVVKAVSALTRLGADKIQVIEMA